MQSFNNLRNSSILLCLSPFFILINLFFLYQLIHFLIYSHASLILVSLIIHSFPVGHNLPAVFTYCYYVFDIEVDVTTFQLPDKFSKYDSAVVLSIFKVPIMVSNPLFKKCVC